MPEASPLASYALKQAGLEKLDAFIRGRQVGGVKFSEKIVPSPTGRPEQNIIWVETSGSLEAGPGQQSKFGFSGQIRFKRVEPYESPSGTLPPGGSLSNTIQFPITSALALAMPAGSRLELSGAGALNAYQQSAGETLSLVIQKLADGDKIAAELTGGQSYTGSLGYQYQYDPQVELGSIGQYILEKLGMASWLAPLSGGIKAQKQQTEKTIKRVVFDLSDPQESQAYENLFTQLSLAKAENFTESESFYDIDASATIANTPFTFYHVSETQKTTYSASESYQESKSIYERLSKWFSKLSVVWEWVSNNLNSYCHLTYQSPYTSDFFDIADSFQIPVSAQVREILNTSPKAQFQADIFFTKAGIKKIQSTTFDQAFGAYGGQPVSTDAKRYGEIQNKHFFTRWYFIFERQELEKRNPDFEKDSSHIADAYVFAEKMQPFNESFGRFSDMKSIAALMKLAGPSETKIHELSIAGPGIRLFAPDEGEISRESVAFASSPKLSSDQASESGERS